MNNFEFFYLFYNQQPLFWFAFALCACVFYLLYKPYVISILDPLLFSAIITSFGASVVLFMYFTGAIKPFYLASYFVTQFAFILGIYSFKPFNSLKNVYQIKKLNIPNSTLLLKFFFVINSLLLIFFQIQVFIVAGIPIFANSRLDTFSGGSGFGIISRFIEVTQIFSSTLLFYLLINKNLRLGFFMKLYTYLFAILLIIFAILNGSKGGILLVLYTAFTAWIFSFDQSINLKVSLFIKKYKIIILSSTICIALTVVFLQTNSDLNLNPIEILGTRFIFAGDVFWYAYPNDVIIKFNNYNGIKALFTDFIGFFRFENWDKLTGHFGVDLFSYHHFSTATSGPNARHNVFGLLYFGFWGSALFSLLIGILVSVIRNLLPVYLPKSFFSMCVLSYLFIKVVPAIDTDPILCFTYLNNLFIVTPILLFLVFIAYKFLFKLVQ